MLPVVTLSSRISETAWERNIVKKENPTVPVNGSVQNFWILEQPKFLSVEEALLKLAEEDGKGILIDT